MKKSELNKLLQEYHALQAKLAKKYDHKVSERIKELGHRYYRDRWFYNMIKSLKNPITVLASTCKKSTMS